MRRSAAISLIAHAVLTQVFTYAFRPALSYAALDSGAPGALLGLLSAVFAIPALLLALPAGRFVDQVGERRTGAIGAAVLVLAATGAAAAPGSLVAVVGATLLLGCGHLLSVVSEQAAVANASRAGRRDSAFGLYTLAVSAGQTLGPLLLSLPSTTSRPPVQAVFLVCVAVAVALGGTLLGFSRREGGSDAASVPGMLASASSLLRTRGVVRALLSSSLALASVDITLAYWPALGDERMLPPAIISLMLAVRALLTMLSRGALGPAVRVFGRRPMMVVTLLAAALALGAMALPFPPVLLVALAGVYGLAIGICQPVTMSWLTDLAPGGQRGMTMSLRLAGNRIGQAAVPATVGALAAATGVGGVLVGIAGALLVAAWAGAAIDATPSGGAGGPERTTSRKRNG